MNGKLTTWATSFGQYPTLRALHFPMSMKFALSGYFSREKQMARKGKVATQPTEKRGVVLGKGPIPKNPPTPMSPVSSPAPKSSSKKNKST